MLSYKDWKRVKKQKMSKEKFWKTFNRLNKVLKKWGLDQDFCTVLYNNILATKYFLVVEILTFRKR